MHRLSWPGLLVASYVLPALVIGITLFEVSSLPTGLARDGQWGVLALFIVLGAGFLGIWLSYMGNVYDVWMGNDVLVLRRGVRRLELPIDCLTRIEAPVESVRLFPEVWLHWTDETGARRTARFITARSPHLDALRTRVTARNAPRQSR